ncbi:50S ribosomal protein L15 [Candidatus Pacearchaeota archaeon ex4484_71]|nr:MAG: 50S ribosomal protein L15 [Candidatus Pacearchaeota archaeon ex4484_71]
MKVKKKKKSIRMRGRNMGTHGSGARKNKRKSGNKGGIGMSGSGKRADHKKTKIQKIHGHGYFGKKGFTSMGTKRDIRKRINVGEISLNIEKYGKKSGDSFIVELKKYKILGSGEVNKKLKITCFEASKSAIEKVKKAGGEVIVKEIKEIKTPLVINPKHEKKKGKK